MVGRDGELALLASAYERASLGDAQVVIVRGVAGIGKTRLVRELVVQDIALPGVAFGHAQPPPGESLPFGVCADLLRSVVRVIGVDRVRDVLGPETSAVAPLVPMLGAGSEGAVDRFALMAATQDLLCEVPDAAAPLLLVVEDAHWSDSSSMEMLVYWARSLVRGRVMLLFTTRPAVEDESVAGQLGALERLPNATTIDVLPLDVDQVRAQALALDPTMTTARIAGLTALAEGIPLYVEELVAHGGDGISPAVALDLSAGLRALSPSTVRVLELLALEARPVETATLAVLLGAPTGQVEKALDEAYARGLVARPGPASWRFHHELLRRAAVESQSPSSQVAGHRAWAKYLDGLPNPRLDDLVASATHRVEAGDSRAAFLAFRAAALVADRVAPSVEAFGLWRSALTLVHDDPRVASEAEYREIFGRACAILVSGSTWTELVEAAQAAFPQATGTLGWFFRSWRYNMERRRGNDAARFLPPEQLASVRDQLLEEPPDVLLAVTLFELFLSAAMLGYADQMDKLADALAQVAAALPLGVLGGMDVVVASRLATLPRSDAAARRLEVVETALAAARDRDWATLSWLHGTYAAELISDGRLREGLTQAETSMALVPGEEHEPHWYYGALSAIWGLWLTGRWNDSVALAERCHDNEDGGAVEFLLFQAALRRGQPVAGFTSAVAEGRSPATSSVVTRLCRRMADARSAVLAHDGQAPTRLREALDDVPAFGGRSREALILLAEIASELPTRDTALEAAMHETAGTLSCYGALDDAWQVHLDAVLRRLDGEDDAETWQRAAHTWDGIGAPVEAARCRLPWAQKLLVAGDPTRAAHELGTALSAFDSVGAAPSSVAVRRLAGQARLKLADDPVAPSSGRAGLTAREYEVLQLLVTGLTNEQIARKLYMSPKTASVHVSHILGKLGAANRTEVAAIAHQRGLIAH